ncbi:MAG TPA: hypothetical protein VLE69_04120 [Candidatus Saccharimonadales bacterium]|nr:hypothetical protein [Candidatus Saccharimonadales bacterium]
MATKTKQKKQDNKVKIASRFKVLPKWKQASMFALAFGLIGGIVVFKSFAASALHYYYYNTPNIGHTGGGGAGVYQTDFNGQVITWNSYDIISEGYYTWFGPYVNISGNHSLETCWIYLSPTSKNATMLFDVIYTTYSDTPTLKKGHHLLWSSGNKTIPASARINNTIYVTQRFCKTIQLGNGVNGVYPSLEIRAKAIDIGSGSGNEFKLWRTTWRYL